MHTTKTTGAVLLVAWFSGCTDDIPILRPGPCVSESVNSYGGEQRCTFTYDDERLAHVDCTRLHTYPESFHGAHWDHDDEGNVTSVYTIVSNADDTGVVGRPSEWTWGSTDIKYIVRRYDTGFSRQEMLERDTFAFLPMIGNDVVSPINDVTRVKVLGHTYTETTQGNVVTRTRDDGETVTWELDSSGHLVMSQAGICKRTWQYDGDVITATTVRLSDGDIDAETTRSYQYDDAGNVVAVTGDYAETRERYDYSCW